MVSFLEKNHKKEALVTHSPCFSSKAEPLSSLAVPRQQWEQGSLTQLAVSPENNQTCQYRHICLCQLQWNPIFCVTPSKRWQKQAPAWLLTPPHFYSFVSDQQWFKPSALTPLKVYSTTSPLHPLTPPLLESLPGCFSQSKPGEERFPAHVWDGLGGRHVKQLSQLSQGRSFATAGDQPVVAQGGCNQFVELLLFCLQSVFIHQRLEMQILPSNLFSDSSQRKKKISWNNFPLKKSALQTEEMYV